MAVYTIKKQRLVRQPDGKSWFLQALDGAEDDSTWDRLIIDYEWTGRADVKISVVSMNQKEIRWKDTVVDLAVRRNIIHRGKIKIYAGGRRISGRK